MLIDYLFEEKLHLRLQWVWQSGSLVTRSQLVNSKCSNGGEMKSRRELVLICVCLPSIATLPDTCTYKICTHPLSGGCLCVHVGIPKIMFRVILYDCMVMCADYVLLSIAAYSDVSGAISIVLHKCILIPFQRGMHVVHTHDHTFQCDVHQHTVLNLWVLMYIDCLTNN